MHLPQVGHIDVLLLQDHKLSAQHATHCGNVLLGCFHTFWEPSIGSHGRSGGVCISIGASLVSSVDGHGSLVPDRALWVSLDSEGSTVGILNVYAPMDLQVQAAFWLDILDALPDMDSWIIGGDFDNVETLEDQHGRCVDFKWIVRGEQSCVGVLPFCCRWQR